MPFYENGQRPPAQKLYKYLKPEHVEGAVTDGRFRIGTLHEYRDAEKYPGAQLDRGEGYMVMDGEIGFYSSEAGHPPPPVMDAFFGPGFRSAKNVIIQGSVFRNIHTHTPNLYIFCCSHRFNLEIHNRPEYGAAVLISDEYAFCGALTRTLRSLGVAPNEPVASGEIRYRHRRSRFSYNKGKLDTDVNVPPFFVKPDVYKDEHEWRFAWDIAELRHDLVITCPEAAQFVTEFDPAMVRPESNNGNKPGFGPDV